MLLAVRLLLVLAFAVLLSGAAPLPAASGAPAVPTFKSFVVDAFNDAVDANPGDGNCVAEGSGLCTLRAAVMEANAYPGADEIVLPAGLVFTLSRPGPFEDASETGDLDVTEGLLIRATGNLTATISATVNFTDRILHVGPNITTTLVGITVRGGHAESQSGGGILNQGSLTLHDATVTANTVDVPAMLGTAQGGGLYNTVTATLLLDRSTVSANFAENGGGGIYNVGQVFAVNSTFSGNTTEELGGGLSVISGTVLLRNVTIASNFAASTGGTGFGGGLYVNVIATADLRNTIVGNNWRGPGASAPDDCSGTLTSSGYNLIQTITGCTVTGNTTGNIIGQNPLLGILGNHGGFTLTRALLEGSPAREAGNPGGCTNLLSLALITDQRGYPRHIDSDVDGEARCDIGAYEAMPPHSLWLPAVLKMP